jgi:hypothetical protein
MEEQDYIDLQNLLTKLRVHLLKEISNPNLIQKYRDVDIRMIRSIDNLRKNTPIIVKMEE